MPISGWLDLFHDSYTFRVIRESYAIFYSIFPGLVIGIAVSSWMVAWRPLEQVRSWRFMDGYWAVFIMACIGVVSPFCSYLAIPIAAALILGGVRPGPVFAFLCSTPLMNPSLFAMTWSALGFPLAIARVIAALGFGVLGGFLASRYSTNLIHYIKQQSPDNPVDFMHHKQDEAFTRRWRKSFLHLGWFALKYVMLGIVIASVVKELIPISWIEAAVGKQYGHGVLAGALLGVPLYACGGGTIPLIQVMMSMGMSNGAALAFFIAGPATKLSTLVALRLTVGTTTTIAYVTLSIVWSIFAGMACQIISPG